MEILYGAKKNGVHAFGYNSDVGLSGWPFPCGWPHYLAARIRYAMMILVKSKLFSD